MREEFVVSEENGDVRLDLWLAEMLTDYSRSELQRLIQDGEVSVDGQAAKPSTQVFPGQRISIELPEEQDLLVPSDVPFFNLYEDEDIVVVDKPAGVVVHPGVENEKDTLVQGLIYREIELADTSDPSRPGIVHRLDKDTSGVIVLAKSNEAYENLILQFQERVVRKFYLALVWGRFQTEFGRIEAPIGRDPHHPTKMKVMLQGGKEAFTEFHAARKLEDRTAVIVRPITGRTHQIRVHFRSIKHPVLGDPIYGSARKDHFAQVERMMLHAWRLRFQHPISAENLEFTSPPPAEFEPFFDADALDSPLLRLE